MRWGLVIAGVGVVALIAWYFLGGTAQAGGSRETTIVDGPKHWLGTPGSPPPASPPGVKATAPSIGRTGLEHF